MMETVLTGMVVIFLIIFAMFSFGGAIIHSITELQITGQEIAIQNELDANTHLRFVDAYSSNGGTEIHLILQNDGETRLMDFAQWDSIIHFTDTQMGNNSHVDFLSFTSDTASAGQWELEGIYWDINSRISEVFEPRVLNPREDLMLHLVLPRPAASGTPAQAIISLSNGISSSYQFSINQAPVLSVNSGIMIAAGTSKTLDTNVLQVTDADDSADELVYTITTPSTEGNLSSSQFSQTELNDGQISYNHTGTGDDQFEFTVSDGKDLIGSYSFDITINLAPSIVTNNGLSLPINSIAYISPSLLAVSDPDNSASEIIFTVVVPPTHGLLNLGSSFSQEDIDNHRLFYSNQGILGGDSFQFVLSDGYNTLGPFTFMMAGY